jgi:hypothetical protein
METEEEECSEREIKRIRKFFWNFCECNVYCFLLFIIYFTGFGNVNMFPMSMKPLELN